MKDGVEDRMDQEQQRLVEELLFAQKKRPSFVKRLFLGEFGFEEIFPYPMPSEEQDEEIERYAQSVGAYADLNIDAAAIDSQAEIPQEVLDGLGALGVMGITIPKEYGGLGMTQRAYCRACEELARRCGSTALFVNAHQSVGLKALLLYGTAEQKGRWLEPLARGKAYAAFALTEPNAGSDAAGIETRATWDSDKGVYRLEGKKQWITNGSIASVLTVMAKMTVNTPEGPKDKITAFLVTPEMAGFEVVVPALDKVGMRGTKTSILALNGVEVPPENILGEVGAGLRICLTVLDYGRTTFGATCTGTAKVAVERAFKHARSRYQFGKPLAAFPLIKRKLATMAALLYAMESTTYLTAGLIDKGVEDIMLEAAILKVFASESLWYILYEAMQIFGGRSFFTDLPLERMMRDSRLNMIGEGANEVLRAFIGGVGLRDVGTSLQEIASMARHPWRYRHSLSTGFKRLFRHLYKPEIPLRAKELSKEAAFLSQQIRSMGWASVRLLMRYRAAIVDEQLQLDRLATAAIALYTSSAVLSRLDRAHLHGIATEQEHTRGTFYAFLAHEAFSHAITALTHNGEEDSRLIQAADLFIRI